MSKPTSAPRIDIAKFDLLPNLTGLLHAYGGGFLADDGLTDVEVIVVGLYLSEKQRGQAGIGYNDLRSVFVQLGRKEQSFKVAIHRAKADGLIEDRESEIRFLIGGLRKAQKLLGEVGKSTTHVVKAGQSFTAIKLFEDFLRADVRGPVLRVCDAYAAPGTLHPFSILKGGLKEILLLTSKVSEGEKLEAYTKKFHDETGIAITIRTNPRIHDGYLLADSGAWSIGSSIKDLGNKDTVIQKLEGVGDSLLQVFEERWRE